MLSGCTGLAPPLPAAALRRLALRGDPGDTEWLCLDPIRLRFAERALIVDDPRALCLTGEESAAFAVALAPTFASLGRIEALSPGMWNLRLSGIAPDFQALPEAAGRAAAPLPQDAAYAPWRHAINEAQILEELDSLFAHYARDRHDGEHFGDFVIRAGHVRAVTHGSESYDP